MGNLQKYGGFDLDTMDAEDADLAKGARPSEFLKMEDGGAYSLRFLPPPLDAAWAKNSKTGKASPFKVIHEHFVEVPGQKRKFRFVCPRMEGGGTCPACDQADALYRTGNALDKDKAYDLRPSPRVYTNVIDRENPDRGPVIFAFGKGVKEDLSRLRKRYGDFTNPTEEGYDIHIDRTNKNGRISYTVSAARGGSELGDEAWLEQQFNLDTYARVATLEEIEEGLSGDAEAGGQKRRRNSGTARIDGSKQLGAGRAKRPTAGDDIGDVIEAEVVEDNCDVPL